MYRIIQYTGDWRGTLGINTGWAPRAIIRFCKFGGHFIGALPSAIHSIKDLSFVTELLNSLLD